MSESTTKQQRSIGWMGLKRGHRARPSEWIAEKLIFAVSLSSIVTIFLIFLFVGRMTLPIVFEQMNSAAVQPVIPVERLGAMTKAEVMSYLELTEKQYAGMDQETLRSLMEVKVEAATEAPAADKDDLVNTTRWRYLLLPQQWSGYERPEYIWQPISRIHKYNIIPLVLGSLKTTLVALLVGVPLALGAALYISQLASQRVQETVKPCIELLAGVPSVVTGFFMLIVMATVLKQVFGYESRLNAFVAGVGLSLAVIPVVFSISEDALTSVPRSYTQAALALGASRWQAAWQVVLPSAMPGVFAAVVLGFGRAIGETMIVLMASGNASIMSASLFDSTRTITASIAAELAEAVFGGHHYRILFTIGLLLFVVTFVCNFVGDLVVHRLKLRLEGKA